MTRPEISDTSDTSDTTSSNLNKTHRISKSKSRYIVNERRGKVQVMLSQGLTETEIASQLIVNQSTISRDVNFIKKESQRSIQDIVRETFPFEFSKSILSLNHITKACWNIYNDKTSKWTTKDKLNALKLARDTERTKFEVLMHGPIDLLAQKLQEEVKEVADENQNSRKSYFMLPAIQRQNEEDLR